MSRYFGQAFFNKQPDLRPLPDHEGYFNNTEAFGIGCADVVVLEHKFEMTSETIMNQVIDWREHTGSNPEKFFKSTLWQGEHLMIGLNCLEPNQTQSVHAHQGADKLYVVLEGSGRFTIGEDEHEAGPGMLVVAPAGVPHGVTNRGIERLSLLVAIAPGFK